MSTTAKQQQITTQHQNSFQRGRSGAVGTSSGNVLATIVTAAAGRLLLLSLILLNCIPATLLPQSPAAESRTDSGGERSSIPPEQEGNEETPRPNADQSPSTEWTQSLSEGLYAQITFDAATVVVQLQYSEMPSSVSFFVGLAAGLFQQEQYITSDTNNAQNTLSPFLYNGGNVTEHTPYFALYADIHPLSPKRFSQISFKREKYFTPYEPSGKGFLALLGPTPVESNRHIALILNSLDVYPYPLAIIGKIVSGMDALSQNTNIKSIRNVAIKAKGASAEQFLNSVNFSNFLTQQNTLNYTFDRRREEKISETLAELRNSPSYRESDENIFFEFIEGSLEDNTPYLSSSTLTGSDLVIYLLNSSISISTLSNSQLSRGATVSYRYRIRTYPSGPIIDDTIERGKTARYQIGRDRMLPGIQLLLTLMSPGQKIQAVIPPKLGYGMAGWGKDIKSADFLEIELHMLDIRR